MKNIDIFIRKLQDIVELVTLECDLIDAGRASKWDRDQLDGIVLPEINELLAYARKGKVFFKYGKRQRLLESSYVMTDSLENLYNTILGKKIVELQDFYDTL